MKPNPLDLVPRLIQGEEAAVIELYQHLRRSIRPYLNGMLRSDDDVADVCHDTFIDTLEFVQAGRLSFPQAIFSVMRTIACRKATQLRSSYCLLKTLDNRSYKIASQELNGYQKIWQNERVWLLRSTLLEMKPARQEILIRFYLKEEDRPTIIQKMGLTETTYRLKKSRAKSELIERAQRRIHES